MVPSGTRVATTVHLAHAFPIDVSVDLRGPDVGVAEELLDFSQAGPAAQEVGRVAVSQGVRGDGRKARGCCVSLHDAVCSRTYTSENERTREDASRASQGKK